MRSRSILLTLSGALAVSYVYGVYEDQQPWRFAQVTALLLITLAATLTSRPRWIVPTALAPLLLQASLTIPSAGPPTYGWQVLTTKAPTFTVIDALDGSLRLAGAPLLFAAVLVTALKPGARPTLLPPPAETRRSRWPALMAAVIVLYAVARVIQVSTTVSSGKPAAAFQLLAAVLAPTLLGCAAVALAVSAAHHRKPVAAAGALLLALAALPAIDSMILAVPLPYSSYGFAADGFFSWHAFMPTMRMHPPVPAAAAALQFLAYLLVTTALTSTNKRPQESK